MTTIQKTKPKIGVLGIMQELYDKSLPGITKRQEEYAQNVCEQLSDVADWDFPKAARNRADIEEILGDFNHKGLDGVMIMMLTYGPAMRTVRALQKNNLPILLANIGTGSSNRMGYGRSYLQPGNPRCAGYGECDYQNSRR